MVISVIIIWVGICGIFVVVIIVVVCLVGFIFWCDVFGLMVVGFRFLLLGIVFFLGVGGEFVLLY